MEKLKSLEDIESNHYIRVSASQFGSNYKISLNLRRSFCEEVVEFMEKLFIVLGIDDQKKYSLSDFTIETTSMHRQGEGWIPYVEHFKLKMGLYIRDFSVEIMPDTSLLT